MDLLEDDEEVLVDFAKQIGGLLDIVGGPAHAEHLFKLLEQLSAVEEIKVREEVSGQLTVGNRKSQKNIVFCAYQRLRVIDHEDDASFNEG